jgi:hypothetical protein
MWQWNAYIGRDKASEGEREIDRRVEVEEGRFRALMVSATVP